jgi:hypothetical protein
MGKVHKKTFLKVPRRYMKKWLDITNNQTLMQIKTTMRYHLTLVMITIIKKKK